MPARANIAATIGAPADVPPTTNHPVAPFFTALTNPLMKPVKRVIPPVGGVDISPIFVLIFLQLLLMLPVAWLEGETAGMLSRALL